MSNKNRKSPSSLVPRPKQLPSPDPVNRRALPAIPADACEDGEPVAISRLTHRQQAALPIIAFATTRVEAARLSGVGKSTLRRWYADPVFRQNLENLQRDTHLFVGQQIQGLLPLCVSVFADAMRSPDPKLRLRAARYVLPYIFRRGDSETLSAALQELEAAAHSVTRSQA